MATRKKTKTKKAGKRVGRPPKRSKQVEELLCLALEAGLGYGNAAARADIAPETFRAWRAADPEFSARCEKSRTNPVERVSKALIKAALEGDVKAQQFFLSRRAEEYRERAELTIQTPEERAEAIEEYRRQLEDSMGGG